MPSMGLLEVSQLLLREKPFVGEVIVSLQWKWSENINLVFPLHVKILPPYPDPFSSTKQPPPHRLLPHPHLGCRTAHIHSSSALRIQELKRRCPNRLHPQPSVLCLPQATGERLTKPTPKHLLVLTATAVHPWQLYVLVDVTTKGCS